MTLPDIIAEVEKLQYAHKLTLLSKLKSCVAMLKTVKGAEHLLASPTPPEPTVIDDPVAASPRKGTRRKVVDSMPEGG